MKKITNYLLPIQTKDLYAKEAVSSISLAHEVADKINEIVNYLNSHEDLTAEKILEQDGKIRKGIIYMKDNLANTIYELLELMKSNGEIDEIVKESINEFIIKVETILEGICSVKNFGCFGDGIHDDTKGLQDAIKYAEETTGILYINPGIYRITDSLNISKSIKIYGSFEKGKLSHETNECYGTHIEQTNPEKNIFNFSDGNSYYGVSISNLRLSGYKRAINVDTTGVFSEFIFEKIHFNGGFEECIFFDKTGTLGRISDCDFSENEIGINANYIYAVTISENNFWNNKVAQIKLGTSIDLRVINNWFEKTVETGCTLLLQAPFSINKNTFLNNEFNSVKTPIIHYDMVTNINGLGYVKNTVFENCRFACNGSDYAIKVQFKNGELSNTNTLNNSFISFKNCIFNSVKVSAINTDSKYINWYIVDCECYNSWDSGNVPFLSGVSARVVVSKNRSGYNTNGIIKFNPITDKSFFEENIMYGDDTGVIRIIKDGIGRPILLAMSGSTENRPSNNLIAGMVYYDTTIQKPCFYNGTMWVDATGNQV